LVEGINIVNKPTEAVLDADEEVGLEEDAGIFEVVTLMSVHKIAR
jgi:hypothetical protein